MSDTFLKLGSLVRNLVAWYRFPTAICIASEVVKGDVRAERALRFKNLLRVIWGQTKLEYCKKRLGSGLGYLDIERRYLGKKKDFRVRS